MAQMTSMERVYAVLHGERPDRPPLSFWYHFPPDCVCGQTAVDAHLNHLARYELDFLKIMNDNPFPVEIAVERAWDLRDLPQLGGNEEGFQDQLDLVAALAAELKGKVPLVTTVFSPWSVLRKIVTPPATGVHHPPRLDAQPAEADLRMNELLAEDRTVFVEALETIAQSLANFTRRCLHAGADGIFLSVREDRVNNEANGMQTYEEILRDCDRQILSVASEGSMNMLHVCGVPQKFDMFASYPTHVINWADRAAGPAISDVIDRTDPVVCAGVDNLSTLPKGTPEQVAAEVQDTVRQAGEHSFMISPGCTYDPNAVPEANLDALAHAVRG